MHRARLPFAAALLLAACASDRPYISQDEEEIFVHAYFLETDLDPTSNAYRGMRMETLRDVACTVHNDAGTWTVRTPTQLRVARSSAPLEFECGKAGYGTARGKVPCLTDKQRNAPSEGLAIFQLLAFGPLAIAAAPVAPAIALQAGSQALLAGAGLAASKSQEAKAPAGCRYLGVNASMDRFTPLKP